MTRKDLIFFSIMGTYFLAVIINIFLYTFMKPEYMSAIIIIVMLPLVILKTFSRKFSLWLQKPLRKTDE